MRSAACMGARGRDRGCRRLPTCSSGASPPGAVAAPRLLQQRRRWPPAQRTGTLQPVRAVAADPLSGLLPGVSPVLPPHDLEKAVKEAFMVRLPCARRQTTPDRPGAAVAALTGGCAAAPGWRLMRALVPASLSLGRTRFGGRWRRRVCWSPSCACRQERSWRRTGRVGSLWGGRGGGGGSACRTAPLLAPHAADRSALPAGAHRQPVAAPCTLCRPGPPGGQLVPGWADRGALPRPILWRLQVAGGAGGAGKLVAPTIVGRTRAPR